MRRVALVGLAGLVVGLACRRRFRRQLAEAVRLPAVVTVAVLVAPFDILDDVWGGVTGIAGDIKNWVLGLVHHLENLVSGWVGDLWNGLGSLGSWVSNLFDSAISFAESIVNAVYGFVRTVFDDVTRWAGEAIGAVYRFASGLVGDVLRWAERAIADVWGWLGGLFKWIYDNVVAPLWDAIQWVWHNVVEPAIDYVIGLIGKAVDFLYGLLKWAFDQVARLWDYIWKFADLLLHLVEKCFGWLLMLATHGPSWVVEQVTGFFHHAPEWLAHELGATMAKEGPTIERTLADWLGG